MEVKCIFIIDNFFALYKVDTKQQVKPVFHCVMYIIGTEQYKSKIFYLIHIFRYYQWFFLDSIKSIQQNRISIVVQIFFNEN